MKNKITKIIGLSIFSMAGLVVPLVGLFSNPSLESKVIESINENKINNFNLTSLKMRANIVQLNGPEGFHSEKQWLDIPPTSIGGIPTPSLYRDINGKIQGPLSSDSITTVYGGGHYFNFIKLRQVATDGESPLLNIIGTPIDESSFKNINIETNFTSINSAIYLNEFLLVSGKVLNLPGSRIGVFKMDSINNTLVLQNDLSSDTSIISSDTNNKIALAPFSTSRTDNISEILTFPIGMTVGAFIELTSGTSKDKPKKITIDAKGKLSVSDIIFKPFTVGVLAIDMIRSITPINLGDPNGDVFVIMSHNATQVNSIMIPGVNSPLESFVEPNIFTPDGGIRTDFDKAQAIPYQMTTIDNSGNFQLFSIFQNYSHNAATNVYTGGDSAILTSQIGVNGTYQPHNNISLKLGLDLDWATNLVPKQINYSLDQGNFSSDLNPLNISIMFSGGFSSGPNDFSNSMGVIRWHNSNDNTFWKRENLPNMNPDRPENPNIFLRSKITSSLENKNQKFMHIVDNGIASGIGVITIIGLAEENGSISSIRKSTTDIDEFKNLNIWTNRLSQPKIVLPAREIIPPGIAIGPTTPEENRKLFDIVSNYYTNLRDDQVGGGGSKIVVTNVQKVGAVTTKIELDINISGGYISGWYNFPHTDTQHITLMVNPGNVQDLEFKINQQNSMFRLESSAVHSKITNFNNLNNFNSLEGIVGYKQTDIIQLNEGLLINLKSIDAFSNDTAGTLNLKLNFVDVDNNIFSKEFSLTGFPNKSFVIPSIVVPIIIFILIVLIVAIILIKKNKRKEYLAKKAGFKMQQKVTSNLGTKDQIGKMILSTQKTNPENPKEIVKKNQTKKIVSKK